MLRVIADLEPDLLNSWFPSILISFVTSVLFFLPLNFEFPTASFLIDILLIYIELLDVLFLYVLHVEILFAITSDIFHVFFCCFAIVYILLFICSVLHLYNLNKNSINIKIVR